MRDKDATGDGDDSMVEEPTSKLAKCAQNDSKNLHEKHSQLMKRIPKSIGINNDNITKETLDENLTQ